MASKEVEANRVVVCGGGLSGLTAAISALEAGVPVTLLEKGAELGGNAILSGGMIWTYADYDRMRADIPNGDAMIQWMIHENIDAARTWLATQGVDLGPDQRCHEDFGLGHQMQPPQAIEALGKRFVELGGDLRLESSLDSLITDNGVVRGVRIAHHGEAAHARLPSGVVEVADRADEVPKARGRKRALSAEAADEVDDDHRHSFRATCRRDQAATDRPSPGTARSTCAMRSTRRTARRSTSAAPARSAPLTAALTCIT